ncbi:SDR family oxidoreductase [Microbacterium panaciterrae]|uniref:SDR family oxidoreductase n=1 Tax=Microbacterium panaciterrae TaxID=985759 RepID=A0ABP8PS12_9MICO
MKVVILGGTGLIGSRVRELLRARGVDAVAASPSTGVDIMTGEGLDPVLRGADAVVDVSKPRTYDPTVLEAYFEIGMARMLAAERAAGVRHHVALAAVGTAEATEVPFYRAKAAGEQVVRAGGVPFTLVHATQFFEFAPAIADSATIDATVVLPPTLVQPIAADDVAEAMADIVLGDAADDTREIAGPEILPLAGFVARGLAAAGDGRSVVTADEALYFGGRIGRTTLLPSPAAQIGPTTFESWMAHRGSSGG